MGGSQAALGSLCVFPLRWVWSWLGFAPGLWVGVRCIGQNVGVVLAYEGEGTPGPVEGKGLRKNPATGPFFGPGLKCVFCPSAYVIFVRSVSYLAAGEVWTATPGLQMCRDSQWRPDSFLLAVCCVTFFFEVVFRFYLG